MATPRYHWARGNNNKNMAMIVKTEFKLCFTTTIHPKSNVTGVKKTLMKNIEIYQSQIPSK